MSATAAAAHVGRYRLLRVIGEGGMGIVHLGLDPDDRVAAVKVLRPHIAADEEARARLAREVAALRRLRHARVAEIVDVDLGGPTPFVATRYVPGPPLDAIVRDHGALRQDALATFMWGLGEAISVIHAAGLVHRDIKPSNVLVLDGEPVVIDFGIARSLDDAALTRTGMLIGTPGYLAPELMAGEHPGRSVDWWGWAAVSAFAATGRPPFGRGPAEVAMDRIRRGEADLDGLPTSLQSLLRAALSPVLTDRPTPAQLRSALAGSIGAPAQGPTLQYPEQPVTAADLPAVHVPPAVTVRQPVLPRPAVQQPPTHQSAVQQPTAPQPAVQQPVAGSPAARTATSRPVTPRPAERVADTRAMPPIRPDQDPPPPAQPRAAQPRAAQPPRPAQPTPANPHTATPTPAATPSTYHRPPVLRRGPSVPLTLTWLIATTATAMLAPIAVTLIAWLWLTTARAAQWTRVAQARARWRTAGSGLPAEGTGAFWLSYPVRWLGAAVVSALYVVPWWLAVVLIVALKSMAGPQIPATAVQIAAACSAMLVVLAWWGAGGDAVRQGTRFLTAPIIDRQLGRRLSLGFAILIAVSAVLIMSSSGVGPQWTPGWTAPDWLTTDLLQPA